MRKLLTSIIFLACLLVAILLLFCQPIPTAAENQRVQTLVTTIRKRIASHMNCGTVSVYGSGGPKLQATIMIYGATNASVIVLIKGILLDEFRRSPFTRAKVSLYQAEVWQRYKEYSVRGYEVETDSYVLTEQDKKLE